MISERERGYVCVYVYACMCVCECAGERVRVYVSEKMGKSEWISETIEKE